ncbi:hypothetical protein L218DRAFT_990292 [Marasmius fiardii PR-910]|nr:hypothetical protein L218DRAFT_990292 [Marasmius fiardii PR-910]
MRHFLHARASLLLAHPNSVGLGITLLLREVYLLQATTIRQHLGLAGDERRAQWNECIVEELVPDLKIFQNSWATHYLGMMVNSRIVGRRHVPYGGEDANETGSEAVRRNKVFVFRVKSTEADYERTCSQGSHKNPSGTKEG